MERVAFHVESTGDRIPCLLNPDSLVIRRSVGVRRRRSLMGPAPSHLLADDPLLFTGGGTTELELELLFDVELAATAREPLAAASADPERATAPTDVRELTSPLWRMAEQVEAATGGFVRPPVVRLVWGKAWNLPAIVSAVAERLERFGPDGAPRRSWMRLRLLRVAESAAGPRPAAPTTRDAGPEQIAVHQVVGAGASGAAPAPAAGPSSEVAVPGERLDELAQRYYGDPSLWRLIAEANGIDDPLHVTPGAVLRIPPRSAP